MKRSIEKQALLELPGILANFLEIQESEVSIVAQEGINTPDFLAEAAGYQFLMEYKSTSAKALLLLALMNFNENRDPHKKDAIPLIVVPYMSDAGIDFCRNHGLSWVDLSGNAHIKVVVEPCYFFGRLPRAQQRAAVQGRKPLRTQRLRHTVCLSASFVTESVARQPAVKQAIGIMNLAVTD